MGFFDFFTDRTPAEPAEIRLVAFVSGKVQGEAFGNEFGLARLYIFAVF